MREIINLNFDWKFNRYEDSHLNEVIENDFLSVNIPHQAVELPFNNFNELDYQNKYTYLKYFNLKKVLKDKKIELIFEGVANSCEIYINKKYIGKNQGAYHPFSFDISKSILFDELNELMVIVDGIETMDVPPFGGVVDYLAYAGIYREVKIEIKDLEYIENHFIYSKDNKEIFVEVDSTDNKGKLNIELLNAEFELVYMINSDVIDYKTIISFSVDNLNLWDLDNPYLYYVKIVYNNQKYIDEVLERIGIRTINFLEDGFYLNNKKIKLLGLNRHQSYPYVGYAMPKSAQVEDADILKYQLGVNIVRTSHYLFSKHFLNRADEIGLLVFEEIPGWQHIGSNTFKELSYENVKKMILRDRNHPSIIMWGVRINESPDDHDFYLETNRLAKLYDKTRQTGGVRNFAKSEFLEDVYTYNDFSHTGKNKGLEKKRKITSKVPYLVTEFNGHMYPTKKYDSEERRINHALRHLNVINEMMNPKNHISGAIGWVMNDYNTHKEFGSGDRVCYHGVLDMYRNPKYASYAYSSQSQNDYVLKVLSDMNIGDYSASKLDKIVILTNLDYVKLYKNEQLIDTCYKDSKTYKHLINPPIIISDFIGNLLVLNEGLSYKDSKMTKNILKAVTVYGNNLPLRFKLKILYLLKKYKMSYDQGVKMFFKYIGGWGTVNPVYKFEGYKDDKLVKTVIKETNQIFDYILESNEKELKIEETYDVRRYTLRKVNQHLELITYAFDTFSIEVLGSLELIGSNIQNLHGGEVSFWVKTKHKGSGTVLVNIDNQIIIDEVNVK